MNGRPRAGDESEPSRASGMTIVSYLLGGPGFWGVIGWLADRAFGFDTLFLPIGLLLGLVGALYLTITQYVRS